MNNFVARCMPVGNQFLMFNFPEKSVLGKSFPEKQWGETPQFPAGSLSQDATTLRSDFKDDER